MIAAQLDRLRLPGGAEILDAGCGGGLLLDELRRHGAVRAVDSDPGAVAAAARRGVAESVDVAPVDALPFADASFDLVTSFDVLEHLPDDRAALVELRRVARPDGLLLVTVPALPALWSSHDVAAGHRRRYRRAGLVRVAAAAGWRLREATSFNTLLLPVAAALRLATRRSPARSDVRRGGGRAVRLLEPALALEARALRAGLRLPVGLSLLAAFEAEG